MVGGLYTAVFGGKMVYEKVKCVGEIHFGLGEGTYIKDIACPAGGVGWNDQRINKGGIDAEQIFSIEQGHVDTPRIGTFEMDESEMEISQRGSHA